VFNHLLVPIDATRASESILPYVTDLARRLGARVTLLTVASTEAGAAPRPAGEIEARLEELAAELRRPGIDVHTVTTKGDPAVGIIAAAGEHGADAIAMSTHSRRGVDRIMSGSIAEQVLRRANVPVLLLRAA